jgi:hypothetical protein
VNAKKGRCIKEKWSGGTAVFIPVRTFKNSCETERLGLTYVFQMSSRERTIHVSILCAHAHSLHVTIWQTELFDSRVPDKLAGWHERRGVFLLL